MEEEDHHMDWEATGLLCVCHSDGKDILALEVGGEVKRERGPAVRSWEAELGQRPPFPPPPHLFSAIEEKGVMGGQKEPPSGFRNSLSVRHTLQPYCFGGKYMRGEN